jgi:hypothetical protein
MDDLEVGNKGWKGHPPKEQGCSKIFRMGRLQSNAPALTGYAGAGFFISWETAQKAAILSALVFSTSECLKKHGKLLKTRLSYHYDAASVHHCLFEGTNRYSREGLHNVLIGMFRGLNNAWRCYEK